MVNTKKVKGTNAENEAVEILNKVIKNGKFKRVPGSGAMGTILGESLLTGDITGEVESFPKKFKGECKVGYSNSKAGDAKSLSFQKKWIDKIKEEALPAYAVPFVVCKFDNVRSGVKRIVALDIIDFAELINMYTELKKELDVVYGELSRLESNQKVSSK